MTAMVLLCSVGFSAEDAEKISEAEAAKALDRIRARYAPQYERFRGVESTRQVHLVEYNTREQKVVHESRIRLVRKDYFYRKPEVTTLAYEKDGKTLAPSDYKPRIDDPAVPILDTNGAANYQVSVAGYKTIGRTRCYAVRVEPKKITPRHFRGTYYYRVDNLDPVFVEGTMAKLAVGIQSYWLRFNLTTTEGVPALASGTITIMVDVALVYPNRKFVTQIVASDNRVIR